MGGRREQWRGVGEEGECEVVGETGGKVGEGGGGGGGGSALCMWRQNTASLCESVLEGEDC